MIEKFIGELIFFVSFLYFFKSFDRQRKEIYQRKEEIIDMSWLMIKLLYYCFASIFCIYILIKSQLLDVNPDSMTISYTVLSVMSGVEYLLEL